MIIALGVLPDIFFIKALLMKIELKKRRFVLEIEQGGVTQIPIELSNNDFPISFQYYNPTLQIIDSMMTDNSRQSFNYQTKINTMENIHKRELQYHRQVLSYFHKESDLEDVNLTFKPTLLDRDNEISIRGN